MPPNSRPTPLWLQNSPDQLPPPELPHLLRDQLPHPLPESLPLLLATHPVQLSRPSGDVLLQQPQHRHDRTKTRLGLDRRLAALLHLPPDDRLHEQLHVWEDEHTHAFAPADGGEADDGAVVRAGGLGGVEKVLETGAGQARLEGVGGVAEAPTDEGEERGGEVAEGDVVACEWVAEALADETGEDWGDEGRDLRWSVWGTEVQISPRTTYIWLDEQVLVLQQGVRQLHHHVQHEHVLQSMRHLLADKLHKVRQELVQARVVPQTRQRRGPQTVVRVVGDRGAHAVEVELQLLGEDVLDEGLHGDVVGGGGRRGGGALGGGLREAGSLGLGGVLGDGGLHALDREPVSCGGNMSAMNMRGEGGPPRRPGAAASPLLLTRGPTSKRHLARHLRQRRVDQLLEVDLVVLHVEDGLRLAQTRLAEPQRPAGLVPVERLDVEHAQGVRDVRGAQDGALRVAHELERLLQDLVHAVLDVHGEVLGDVVGEVRDADGLGDVLDGVGVPEGHFWCNWRCCGGVSGGGCVGGAVSVAGTAEHRSERERVGSRTPGRVTRTPGRHRHRHRHADTPTHRHTDTHTPSPQPVACRINKNKGRATTAANCCIWLAALALVLVLHR